jgi:hypothetical protein
MILLTEAIIGLSLYRSLIVKAVKAVKNRSCANYKIILNAYSSKHNIAKRSQFSDTEDLKTRISEASQ